MTLCRMDPGEHLDEAIMGYVDGPEGLVTVYGYPQLVTAFASMFGEDDDTQTEEELNEMAVEWINFNCTSGPVLILYPATAAEIDELADQENGDS
jgi:hypothetical protein